MIRYFIGHTAVVVLLLVPSSVFAQSAKPAATAPNVPATQKWEESDQRLIFLTVELSSTEASLASVQKAILQTGYQRNIKTNAADGYGLANEMMDRKGGGPVPWDQFYGKTAQSFSMPMATASYRREGSGKNVAADVAIGNQPLERPPQFDYLYKANTEAQQRAEREAAQLGNKIETLLDRRQRLETEQSALWSKIAFQGLEECDLNSKPLYHFALKSSVAAPSGADMQRLDAIRAAAAFVRVGNTVAELTAKGVDGNQPAAYQAMQKSIAAARSDFRAAVLAQPQLALEAADPNTQLGKCLVLAKRLDELAANINDALRLSADRDAAGDEVQKNTFRGALQGSLLHYSEGVLKLDESVSALAETWHVVSDVTTRAPEIKLAGGSEVVPDIPVATPNKDVPEPEPIHPKGRTPRHPVSVADARTTSTPSVPAAPATQQVSPNTAALCQNLDRDFHELLNSEANPAPLRDAAQLLAQTNQNSHWFDFMKATALIRQSRSKAAIPLLMKYMVEHASFNGRNVTRYIDTINILTGEKVDFSEVKGPDRQQSTEQAVNKMYVDWWQPNKKTLTTDLDKMTDERLKFVVSELLRHQQEAMRVSGSNTPTEAIYNALATTFRDTNNRGWWKEELNGRMTPILLSEAGYDAQPAGDVTAGSKPIVFAAIPLLAALRQGGQVPMLDKIAGDPKQNNSTRLACILALHFAGENIDVRGVLSILDTDTRLECRVLSVLTLGLCDKDDAAVGRLMTALDDDNRDIRLAAINSLQTIAPKAALPKLSKIVSDGKPPELVLPSVYILGRIGGNDAAAVLVDYMEKAIKDDPSRHPELLHVVIAFSAATGFRFTVAPRALDSASVAEEARNAIAWWRAQKK